MESTPIAQKIAVVIYGGEFSVWETSLRQLSRFGKQPHRCYIVSGKFTTVPDSVKGEAQRCFEQVIIVPTLFDAPRSRKSHGGFTQRAVYDVAGKILENTMAPHLGPILWLGRPIEVRRATWLEEIDQEFRTVGHIWMGSLFRTSAGDAPISAFVAPPGWPVHKAASAFRLLSAEKSQLEEPVTFFLRDEFMKFFKVTTLFGAADAGIHDRWAFFVKRLDDRPGPLRSVGADGQTRYDPPSLLDWIDQNGVVGLEEAVFSRTVFDGIGSRLFLLSLLTDQQPPGATTYVMEQEQPEPQPEPPKIEPPKAEDPPNFFAEAVARAQAVEVAAQAPLPPAKPIQSAAPAKPKPATRGPGRPAKPNAAVPVILRAPKPEPAVANV